jgi:hypothetical protein
VLIVHAPSISLRILADEGPTGCSADSLCSKGQLHLSACIICSLPCHLLGQLQHMHVQLFARLHITILPSDFGFFNEFHQICPCNFLFSFFQRRSSVSGCLSLTPWTAFLSALLFIAGLALWISGSVKVNDYTMQVLAPTVSRCCMHLIESIML